jgi:selenide,water dikinase
MAQIDGLVRDFNFTSGYAPETSGGLLISLPAENVDAFIQEMHDQHEDAWVIGRVVEGDRGARLDEELTIVEI